MLDRTFVHIPGVGPATERSLWALGIKSWADIGDGASLPVRRGVAKNIREYVPRSRDALENRNAAFFSHLTSIGEAWRMFEAFSDNCVYLDIETTGLSPVFNTITVVGLYDGTDYRVFIDGQNLGDLPAVLKKYSVAVTYNGSQFDLRFLKAVFPNIQLPAVHIDLRWVTRRLGFSGGLKNVEAALGLIRPSAVRKVTGFDATVLWSKYLRGDDKALDLLVQYNTQDVVNLKAIMEQSYQRMMCAMGSAPDRKTTIPKAKRVTPPALASPREHTPRNSSQRQFVSALLEKAARRGAGTRIVGIDLTGSEKRATGWALLDGCDAVTELVRLDPDILSKTIAARPDLVSIDSPLSLPGGLRSPEACKAAGLPIYRACELALKRMGISVFWCLLPTMTSLTLRGMKLAKALRAAGFPVIESYPGAAQDLLRIPRKGTSLDELKWGLHEAGIQGTFLVAKTSHDEVDAITSALVGLFYNADEHIGLGNRDEDYLIVPKSPQINYSALSQILEQTGLDPLSNFAAPPARCA
jgi:uncharacterized protein YprB with RNaseH-like and TPR domain/predicted nuclease with RNAse H fold